MAQNSGWEFGELGSGKLIKSMVTWPITPLSNNTYPIDELIDCKFIFGRDYCGKKQPPLTNSFAVNLSNDPTSCVSPLGSINIAIEGLAIWLVWQLGAASIIPPTRQNELRYSGQLLYRFFDAIITFLGKYFYNYSIT